MLTENQLVERLSTLVTSGAQVNSPEARQLLVEVVDTVNRMPPEQAEAVGKKLATALESTKRTFDLDGNNTITSSEILAVAQKSPDELLALLPASMRGNAGGVMKAGFQQYGSHLSSVCEDTGKLQQTFDEAQPKLNDAIGNVKMANAWGIGFINRQLDLAAGSVNEKLREAFPENAPQLDGQGSKNLNNIISATADALPEKIKLPSAEATCDAINQYVPQNTMTAAADSPPRR